MFDLHCHSEFSIDSLSSMKETTKTAILKNMKSICFTDHVDFSPYDNIKNACFSKKEYFKSLNQVKYTNSKKIEVLSGVEIGMVPNMSKIHENFISNAPFDFVILSMHILKGRNIAHDWAVHELPEIMIKEYYSSMYELLLQYEDYDILGHIDYCDRYIKDKSIIPYFSFYEEDIKKILTHLISHGKGLELNTAGPRHGLKYFHPKPKILSMYRELGGEIITLGSDSHRTEHVGSGMKEAMNLLRELGFKNTYKYVKRKRYALPLG